MWPCCLFSGECSVVVTLLQQTVQRSDSPKHIFSFQMAASYESKAVPRRENRVRERSREQGLQGFPERWRVRNALVHGGRKMTSSR